MGLSFFGRIGWFWGFLGYFLFEVGPVAKTQRQECKAENF